MGNCQNHQRAFTYKGVNSIGGCEAADALLTYEFNVVASARIPLFRLYRQFGLAQMLPINITLSHPLRNSRCLTCNIWMKRENELSSDEWDKVLASLGDAPYWFTISGGEPLMLDIVELTKLAYKHCKPGIINIPTNAILKSGPERVRSS
ncbi:MAG: hypothetical protein R3E31_14410 [Chloroflexota bacterium]